MAKKARIKNKWYSWKNKEQKRISIPHGRYKWLKEKEKEIKKEYLYEKMWKLYPTA